MAPLVYDNKTIGLIVLAVTVLTNITLAYLGVTQQIECNVHAGAVAAVHAAAAPQQTAAAIAAWARSAPPLRP